ncbi:MAG: histidine phosphatase family protein [Acidobacteriia bacterium]|nr:histidine phosphatase family protein [Terriglobia bacterium]
MMPNFLVRVGRLVLPVLMVVWSSATAAAPARTVILVRHAERAGGMSADVGISEAGRCRAELLAKMLADAGVNRIYTSEAARTQQTAEPLAKKLKILPEIVPSKDIDGLVSRLRTGAPDGAALVIGHSNTLPEIIRQMGGGSVTPIGDGEYDRLFIVSLIDQNQATVITLHYAGCAPGGLGR